MLETAQTVVVTAQRGLSNCTAAHARSLEGTLVREYSDVLIYHASWFVLIRMVALVQGLRLGRWFPTILMDVLKTLLMLTDFQTR